MSNTSIRMRRFWSASFALVAISGLSACTTDDDDPGTTEPDTSTSSNDPASGSGGDTSSSDTAASSSSSGGQSNSSDTSTSSSGTACAVPIVLASSTPGIADFEDYDGGAELSTWSFALGGDAAVGIFAGPFGYGDEADGFPESFEMVDGNDSTYALSISDTLSEEYGGGMGIWISECIDASAFSGLSFWVRGNAPTGDSKLSLLMEETTPEADGDKLGTCAGTTDECIAPTFTFPVTDTWTEIQVDWSDFVAGDAAGSAVVPDGSNIWQIQFDIGLVWEPDDTDEYQPLAGEYELVLDTLTFY